MVIKVGLILVAAGKGRPLVLQLKSGYVLGGVRL